MTRCIADAHISGLLPDMHCQIAMCTNWPTLLQELKGVHASSCHCEQAGQQRQLQRHALN